MKHLFRIICLVVILPTLFFSCSPKETNKIYLCGNDSERTAYYWSNGTKIPLSPQCYLAQVTAIKVLDDDVYCAGHIREYKVDDPIAVYWKNGNVVKLTDGRWPAYVEDMYVTYKAVCCVGREADGPKMKVQRRPFDYEYDMVRHYRAKVWFDYDWSDVKELALTKGKENGSVSSVYVDSKHVMHLAGYDKGVKARRLSTLDDYSKARYWKLRAEDWTLADEKDVFEHCGKATTVFGAEDDVYVCGWDDDDLQSSGGIDAMYWKDGSTEYLTEAIQMVIEDGCVNGTDWYLCGHDHDCQNVEKACYYKNGQLVRLHDFKSNHESEILAMDVLGQDVYMAGTIDNQAGYWKNDDFIPLKKISGKVTGIVVREPDIKMERK